MVDETVTSKNSEPQFFRNTVIFVPDRGIPFLKAKFKIWATRVPSVGGRLTQDIHDPDITHLLSPRTRASPPGVHVHVVTPAWLEQSLAHHRHEPESDYMPQSDSDEENSQADDVVYHRKRWLGEKVWRNECAAMSLTELLLHGVYPQASLVGNEPIVKPLVELAKYERALVEDHSDDPLTGDRLHLNRRELRYSRAATVVRGCAYQLKVPVTASQLPFVGDSTAQQINQILLTGTCDALEDFRADRAVTDSKGALRPDSQGGATRRRFHSLPGVGQRTASRWWKAGLRSYEDVECALRRKDPQPSSSAGFSITKEQAFSLLHRDDLLEDASGEEINEMHSLVQRTLESVSRPGWRVELVGGGRRRSTAGHDLDFLCTFPSNPSVLEGVVVEFVDALVKQGRLVPPTEGMCRVQHGLLPTHIATLKEYYRNEESAAPGTQLLDRFDHYYGICKSCSGKYRRLDVIICPPEEWGFAYLGWVGSRSYLRFMRQHAKDRGMFLNSHALMIKEGSDSYLIPQERPPKRRNGELDWPPGWTLGREVLDERDVFILLEVPYRPPNERDCP